MLRFLFGLVSLSLVPLMATAVVEEKAATYVLCKNQKAVRSIRITSNQTDNTCRITYSKGGVDEVVGVNRNMSSCENVLKNIRSNLEGSYWTCKNVSQARILYSQDAVTR